MVDKKSTFGCCFILGSTMVLWFTKKQQAMALSSIEAEYIAVSMASCEAIWLRKMLAELFDLQMGPIVIHCDN